MMTQKMQNSLLNPLVVNEAIQYYLKSKHEDKWNLFVATSEKPQREYRVKMREVFANQLDDIVGNLNRKSVKADFENINFINEDQLCDWNQYRILYNEFGQLELPGIMTAWANLELEAMEIGISFDVTNPDVLTAITNRSNHFAMSVVNETRDRLHKVIADSIQAGDGPYQLEKKIRLLYENMSKYRSTMIARSETIWGQNEGAELGYIQSGVVEAKQWLCAHDERLCPWCAEMGRRDPIPVGTNYFNKGDVLELPKPEKSTMDLMRMAESSGSFDFWKETGEDIYTDQDGIEVITTHGKFIFAVYHKYQKADTIRFTFNYEDIRHPPLHPFCRCCLIPIIMEAGKAYAWLGAWVRVI